MADIRAFAALRYSDGSDLATVTCPPYDVLSAHERQSLASRSPHAAVHVILPQGDGDAKYDHAARLIQDWQTTGVLQTDPAPGLYVTRTDFTVPGTAQQTHRLGLVCLLAVSDYADGHVLPHEKTLTGPKEDRLKLLRATRASVESIMALVDDNDGQIYDLLAQVTKTKTPLATYADDDQTHTLYQVGEADTTAHLRALIAPQPVFIADGHHRYETALAYAREREAVGTDRPEAFLLATITPFSDPGLVVLPTHRMVKNSPPDLLNTIFRGLEKHFDVIEAERDDLESRLRLPVADQVVFGLVMPGGTLYQVTARDASPLNDALPPDLLPSLRQLEPVLLQHLVLGPLLGLDAHAIANSDRVGYTRSFDQAVRGVHNADYDLAFLLPRPPVHVVRDVSLQGGVMPQKSTFFYPKLASGLVMRTMTNEEIQ